jgi:hypothetical protein
VSHYEIAGLLGVALFLAAYAGAQFGKLDPQRLPALLMNLAGAGLVLYSMIEAFNLAAFVLEAAWGLLAFIGLVRLALKRRG